jgi:hypothetical protein
VNVVYSFVWALLVTSLAHAAELAFEMNQGQAAPEVQFLARSPHLGISVMPEGVAFAFAGSRVEMVIDGASSKTAIAGWGRLAGKANYFIGNQPRGWRRDIPLFGRVRYGSVYAGVDLVFYGNDRQLEYDLIVRPGAEPGKIGFRFVGSSAIKPRVQADGTLVVDKGFEFRKPVAYQMAARRRIPVEASYTVDRGGKVGFELGAYDHGRELIVDPVLSYSTFVGGSDDEGIFGIERDAHGNIYVAGETSSVNFPMMNPFQGTIGGSYDAFVSKFDPSGKHLIYSTYLGGALYDHCVGLAVDSSGRAHVAGVTYSTDFPTANAKQTELRGPSDGFVAVLDPSGSRLVFSTYIGGSSNDAANDIAIDGQGNTYITGSTNSVDFPVTAGAYQTTCDQGGVQGSCAGDAFVTKLTSSGRPSYSTYLGGSGTDSGNGIAVDIYGNAYITGLTFSANFPLIDPFQDKLAGIGNAFVTKLNNGGNQLDFSTYLGGNGTDSGQGIALDATLNVYVTGTTTSTTFPLKNPFQAVNKGGLSDGFVTKLSSVEPKLAYSTYIGGSGWDFPFRIAINNSSEAVIVGFTSSTDFPVVSATQPVYAGGFTDAFLVVFDPEGVQPRFCTFLGGSGDEYGYAVHVDAVGNVWAGGSTSSVDFPVANPFQGAYNGGPFDAFLSEYTIPLK